MGFAVAGLDQKTIDERVTRLASGDWSHFHPAEQAAFAFTQKHAVAPWNTGPEDFRLLEKYWGRERAFDVVFHSSGRHYMMRVADGFQLPLERKNVFLRPDRDGAAKKKYAE